MKNEEVDKKSKKDSPDKSIHTNTSTTQGGSNHGQGSSYIAGEEVYKQGSVRNKGANYDNEKQGFGDDTTSAK